MPAGRPSSYDPAYCEQVVEILSRGHSLTGAAGEIGVSAKTIYNWTEQYPEFLHAVKEGRAAAVQYWETIILKIAQGEPGNATAAIFGLKNRAADEWRDKTEQTTTLTADNTISGLLERIATNGKRINDRD